jgi:imidazole glycerol-phosphate synthase subunit HisH
LEKADQDWNSTPFEHLKNKDYVYFVHSFYVTPKDPKVVLSNTTYTDFTYCSAVLESNVFAVQFHPEKSGQNGLAMYKNWGKQHTLC